jgi:hypothetical protein
MRGESEDLIRIRFGSWLIRTYLLANWNELSELPERMIFLDLAQSLSIDTPRVARGERVECVGRFPAETNLPSRVKKKTGDCDFCDPALLVDSLLAFRKAIPCPS